ncbi:uncharacterized protein (TIGR03084 family) [Nakamurella sp. UYEF19]|uniref:TIGR03084 family metal-binding protein n=1 Tax=Nakamurella sp. UYEF19 TaxID=1756392 RepID=UPI00339555B1
MPSNTGDLELVLSDLRDEGEYLDRVVAGHDVDFTAETPAVGWTIGHQIGHLLWTDRVTALACHDRTGFARQAEAFGADPEMTVNAGAAFEASRPADELLAEWRQVRRDLVATLSGLPAGARIPWFGPAMAIGTAAESRIMETWAHGLDVTDALGREPSATHRLRHIAELGIRTRDFAFSIHGSRSPSSPFRVELKAPDGSSWTWGSTSASDRITGTALDFCLLITQRRHRDDLALEATPGMADQWLDIAQVFAGPAGAGRQPQVTA